MTTAPNAPLDPLKECPLCAKAARIVKEGTNYEHRPLFHVACKRSRCKLRTPNQLSAKSAIKIWNHRTPPKAESAPEGYKLVPIEPNDSYYEKIGRAIMGSLTLVEGHTLSLPGWAGFYAHKAMLEAAPIKPESGGL